MKIKLDREKCIGCASCAAVCPKRFEMASDGKSHIIGASNEEKKQIEELEISKTDCADSAAEICPVQCISIEK